MIRAHQPGAEPVDIPEAIPNPAVVPQTQPAPIKPSPRREPVKPPEKAPANAIFFAPGLSLCPGDLGTGGRPCGPVRV